MPVRFRLGAPYAKGLTHVSPFFNARKQIEIIQALSINIGISLNVVLIDIKKMQISNHDSNQGDQALLKGNVYIIEDNQDVRALMTGVLRHYGFSVEAYEDAETFFSLAKIVSPAVILLDMTLPGINGVSAYEYLKTTGQSTPVIYISGNSHPEDIIQAMKLGAKEFFLKPAPIEQLIPAIRDALQKDAFQSEKKKQQQALDARWRLLTDRESEICRMILDGMGNSEIARKLELMPDTVKKHRSKIMEKLNARSLSSLLSVYRNFEPSQTSSEPPST